MPKVSKQAVQFSYRRDGCFTYRVHARKFSNDFAGQIFPHLARFPKFPHPIKRTTYPLRKNFEQKTLLMEQRCRLQITSAFLPRGIKCLSARTTTAASAFCLYRKSATVTSNALSNRKKGVCVCGNGSCVTWLGFARLVYSRLTKWLSFPAVRNVENTYYLGGRIKN